VQTTRHVAVPTDKVTQARFTRYLQPMPPWFPSKPCCRSCPKAPPDMGEGAVSAASGRLPGRGLHTVPLLSGRRRASALHRRPQTCSTSLSWRTARPVRRRPARANSPCGARHAILTLDGSNRRTRGSYHRSSVIELPFLAEPSALKASLNAMPPDVRYASVRSVVAKHVYQSWKNHLRRGGRGWNAFQSANAADDNGWRQWLAGTITWRERLERTIARLNDSSSGDDTFVLASN